LFLYYTHFFSNYIRVLSHTCPFVQEYTPSLKGLFRLERSKDRNKATAVTTKLQRNNALICFTEHTLKRIENDEAFPLRYAKV